uniref:Uncharacterized protein n=1 Tax=viral metagenome TaxID=1070528 RepID=A0A6C0CNY1_9ZZZZ
MAETTVLDNLDDRIKEILDLSNENKKQEAFTKLEKLNQDISAVGSRGRSEHNMSLIRREMMAKQKLSENGELASLKAWAAAREAQQQEDADCLIVGNSVNGDTSGASEQYLERNSNGIVIGFKGSDKNRTCLNRDVLTADNLRNALVEVCTDEGKPPAERGKLYVNMRKLGILSDAIVPLEQVLGYLVGDTEHRRFDLHQVLQPIFNEQVLVIGYGVADTFRGREVSSKANEIFLMNQELMNEYGLNENDLPIADPVVSASLENFIEVSNAVSAAHCEPGDEKTIYHLKPANDNESDYKPAYLKLVGEGFVREITTYNYNIEELNDLLDKTTDLYLRNAPEQPHQYQQYSNEDEDEDTQATKALINCALANYFKTGGGFEDYTADRFDNRILHPFQNYELKLKAIFGGKWVEDKSPEEHGGLQIDFDEDQITSEKLRQVTIDYINREDNNQPVSVKRKELDWVVSASAQVYDTIIADLQEKLLSKIEDVMNRGLKLMDTKDVFDDEMEKMIDRYCPLEDGEDIARGLFSDYPEVGEVSSIESIINCAFGEYYRTGGTFDQISQEKNDGVAVDAEHLNKMKVKHIYSKHWVNVVLFGGDDECSDEEMQQTPDQCIYITPEVLEDIAKDYVEKRFREGEISEEERQQLKDGIRSFGVENTKRELGDLKRKLYDRIQEALDQTQRPAEEFMIINEEDRSQDAATPELITICGDVISSFSDELINGNCNRSLPAVSESVDYDLTAQPDVDSDDEDEVDEFWRQRQREEDAERMEESVSGNGDVLSPISSRSSSVDPLEVPITPEDGGRMSLSDLNGGKKKKRRKSKKGKKTKKKKAKKNKKKTKRRVQFNLKNNEYYTITPKNKIKKNKKRGTRKKKH